MYRSGVYYPSYRNENNPAVSINEEASIKKDAGKIKQPAYEDFFNFLMVYEAIKVIVPGLFGRTNWFMFVSTILGIITFIKFIAMLIDDKKWDYKYDSSLNSLIWAIIIAAIFIPLFTFEVKFGWVSVVAVVLIRIYLFKSIYVFIMGKLKEHREQNTSHMDKKLLRNPLYVPYIPRIKSQTLNETNELNRAKIKTLHGSEGNNRVILNNASDEKTEIIGMETKKDYSEAKFCPLCGIQRIDGARFCSGCGFEFK